jgi:hypothetical protein
MARRDRNAIVFLLLDCFISLLRYHNAAAGNNQSYGRQTGNFVSVVSQK